MSQRIAFTKMQGVGNDFVVVDGREGRYFRALDWTDAAIALCDRRFGVGADGLLVLDDSERATVQMRMFNPDGTPDICGNGLRCIARYAERGGLVTHDALSIETLAGVRAARLHRDAAGQAASVTVGMGAPQFAPKAIPIALEAKEVFDFPLPLSDGAALPITALSTGSTHAVTFVEALPDDARFFAVSPQVEHHALFPERTSLMWVAVETPERLEMRIWERGAGETWGCGTGACAAAVAAVRHGRARAGVPVAVVSRGGTLHVRWQPGGDIEMTGPAEFVFEGVADLARLFAPRAA